MKVQDVIFAGDGQADQLVGGGGHPGDLRPEHATLA